ncbi:MAG: diaminopimelate epimerase [Abditibacteriota bacterium]|nr:diaminopimelate epimerase [Abditibacteriota bacterium]
MTPSLRFVKMHGIGNDFVVVDCRDGRFSDEEQSLIARGACDRHFGIGGDGTVLVYPSSRCDLRMRMFNPDGTEAEMCGNGIRAFAKYVYDYGLSRSDRLSVETLAGVKYIELFAEDGVCRTVKVNMGTPRLLAGEIPFAGAEAGSRVLQAPVEACGREFAVTCVNMGNPHCVTIVEDVGAVKLDSWGPALERHPLFPQKTNVEFIEIADESNVLMRVWERGAAETLACGTGACASAVAAHLNGRTGRKVNMHLAGGDLQIEWAEDGCVYMTGPAETVFEGEVPPERLGRWLKGWIN